jgi:hypothetical protein
MTVTKYNNITELILDPDNDNHVSDRVQSDMMSLIPTHDKKEQPVTSHQRLCTQCQKTKQMERGAQDYKKYKSSKSD